MRARYWAVEVEWVVPVGRAVLLLVGILESVGHMLKA
jgi:hypothetical protein